MASKLELLERRITRCRRCPRLVAWRAETAANPPRRYAGERYWARPVPGFGDPAARLVVVGRDDGFKAEMDRLVHYLGLGPQFHFAGALYGRDALPVYVDADLFCITPTHFEETSLAALTACACGTPALSGCP